MKRVVACAVLAFTMAGCSPPTPTAPAELTPTSKTSAQVASAVAKNRLQLEEAMAQFEQGYCETTMKMAKDALATFECVSALTATGAQARLMAADLEKAKPWPDEVRDLAAETMFRLDNMSTASNYGDGKSLAQATDAIQFLRAELQAWKPFGG